jgi:hypothetical protein
MYLKYMFMLQNFLKDLFSPLKSFLYTKYSLMEEEKTTIQYNVVVSSK